MIATLRNPTSPYDGLFTAIVQRLDVDEEVVALGRIASTQSTEIRCTLEKLDSSAAGGTLVSGASTILALVPEGSMVKKGEVLCELDSSAYQELVRRQKITVEQVKADHQQAVLALDVAKLASRRILKASDFRSARTTKGRSHWPRRTCLGRPIAWNGCGECSRRATRRRHRLPARSSRRSS